MKKNWTIPEQIKKIRFEKGITQQELADLAGLQQPAVSRLEKGEMGVTLHTLIKVAVALGKRIEIR